MTHGSLFSGIGGFDLAAEWAGWQNVFHCEYEPFAQQVLKHHFPNSKLYKDVRTFDATDYAGRIDILTGGFPCQPFSTAGKRKGTEDERHLWPEMLRIIREISPRYVVGENVRGLVNWNGGLVFEEVCSDLESEGYEVLPFILPACAVNAPHRRDRIWFIAYADYSNDRRTPRQNEGESSKKRLQKRNEVREFIEPSEILRNATDSNSNGQQQEWRYDGGCKNVEGSKEASERRADTKNADRCNTYAVLERQTEADRKTSAAQIHKKNKATSSNGASKLAKEPNDTERLEQTNKHKKNNSRSLVQERQTGFQLSECKGVVTNNPSTNPTPGAARKNDLSRVHRMAGDVTDANDKRLQRRANTGIFKKSRQKRNKLASGFICSKWENFPTQPPLCGGDNGISRKLDGITFSKWRKESIKAYGNAIVPQVAYEIFKVINKIENELLLR